MDLEMKFSRAKTWLLITSSAEASILQGMPMIENKEIAPTMGINATHIFYNSEWCEQQSELQLRGLLLHEAEHLLKCHNIRKGDRDAREWNIACDKPINQDIKHRRSQDARWEIELPNGGVYPNDDDEHLSAEEHYNKQIQEKGDGDCQGEDQGDGQGQGWGEVLFGKGEDNNSMSDKEINDQKIKQYQKIIKAYDVAKSRGQVPSYLEDVVKDIKRSMVDWRDILRRFLGGDELEEYSLRKPNKRVLLESNIFLPTLEGKSGGNVVVAVDSSGSVSDEELSYFLGELNAISKDTNPQSITIIPFSSSVGTVKRYEQGEEVEQFQYDDRGGTNVEPVFRYIQENNLEVDHFICLTDLGIYDFPDTIPNYPCLWVSTHEGTAPFGEVTIIQDWR